MNNTAVRLDHVQLRFGSETIFQDLSFEVRQGEAQTNGDEDIPRTCYLIHV